MYAAFTISAFQTQLAYRSQVWTSAFGELVHVFARVAIWMSVYTGVSSVSGVALPEMITYAILSGTVTAAWRYASLINTIGKSLKTGDVAIYLLKPLHYPLYLFATESGNLAYRLLVVVVPVVTIVALIYGIRPPASLIHGLMFVAYWAMSFVILFLIAALFGLIAFWLLTAFSLEWLLQGILSVLSGGFVPLWFFPEPLGMIARHLPFAWIGYYPTAVYLGKLSFAECWGYFGIGMLWVVLLTISVILLWRRASLRLIIQGG
jgi:ABC-2 type transport system permease protein